MSLKEALKTPTSTKNSSSKTPKFYNQKKTDFINEMANSPFDETRTQVAGSENVPAGTLKSMIENEQDTDVLRVVLMNPRTPLKAIIEFTSDDRADVFDDDDTLLAHLKARTTVEE